MNRTAMVGAMACLMVFGTGVGMESSSGDTTVKIGFKSSGYVYWENYRIWKSSYTDGNDQITADPQNDGDWFNDVLGGFVLENTMSEHLRTRVAMEASFHRPFPITNNAKVRDTKADVYIHEAKALYAFRDMLKFPTEVEVGYFLYDYNPDQQNLGEYLFRSKIYPLNLFTNFELPKDRLLGIRIGTELFPGFHQDFLLTSEYKYYPKSDYTPSYVVDYKPNKIFDFGAGVSCVHCLAVKPSMESPKNENNMYVKVRAQTFLDTVTGITHSIAATSGLPAIVKNDTNYSYLTDSITLSRSFYPKMIVDTGYYTFQGVSAMGRFSLDPKPLFGSPSFLGEQDLKLYGEFAVLGVKDYPVYYSSMLKRTPRMMGFNFPGFKVLDVISLEMEYCANPYPNDWQLSLEDGNPIPGGRNFTYQVYSDTSKQALYAYSPWKWSVYLRKQLSRGLSISAQMARDHLRLPDYNGKAYEELLKASGQYWGIIRITASY